MEITNQMLVQWALNNPERLKAIKDLGLNVAETVREYVREDRKPYEGNQAQFLQKSPLE